MFVDMSEIFWLPHGFSSSPNLTHPKEQLLPCPSHSIFLAVENQLLKYHLPSRTILPQGTIVLSRLAHPHTGSLARPPALPTSSILEQNDSPKEDAIFPYLSSKNLKVKGGEKSQKNLENATRNEPEQSQASAKPSDPYSEGACVRNPGVIPAKRQVAGDLEKSMECGAARQEEMQVGWKLNADEIDGGQGRSSVNLLLAIKDMKGLSWLVAFVTDGGFLATSRSCTL